MRRRGRERPAPPQSGSRSVPGCGGSVSQHVTGLKRLLCCAPSVRSGPVTMQAVSATRRTEPGTEPTANSVRSAPAVGGGSPRAFGCPRQTYRPAARCGGRETVDSPAANEEMRMWRLYHLAHHHLAPSSSSALRAPPTRNSRGRCLA
jgi:hypothetical protein